MEHSPHYPTMIEHPKTRQRVRVNTPLQHHKQLLAWKLEGLDPVPEERSTAMTLVPKSEPGYPTMIENEKTGERVQVNSRAEHDQKLAFWNAKTPKSTTRQPAAPPPPPPPPAQKKNQGAGKTNSSKGKGERLQPPTVEELMAKNYPEKIAQRMADEEIRKFNAGEPPYDDQ